MVNILGMDEMLRIGVDPGNNGGVAYSFLGKTYALKMPPTDFDVVAILAGLGKQSRLVELYLEEPSTGGWGRPPSTPLANCSSTSA